MVSTRCGHRFREELGAEPAVPPAALDPHQIVHFVLRTSLIQLNQRRRRAGLHRRPDRPRGTSLDGEHHDTSVAWRKAECPVRQAEQAWIDESMEWLVAEFGRERLLGEVVLPTDDYFPGVYDGSRDDVAAVLDRLCNHMGVDPARVDLEHDDSADDGSEELSAEVLMHTQADGAAGHHRIRGDRSVVSIRTDQARRPMALVATIAHELGHVLLLGESRISPERKDHEPLTDLLTVYFGLGIFGANAAFDYVHENRGRNAYARTSRLGYLTEPMFGYGMARYAWLRGEVEPDWSRYLDTNPRTYLKQGLRYLRQAG
jgi:hypothetical protein